MKGIGVSLLTIAFVLPIIANLGVAAEDEALQIEYLPVFTSSADYIAPGTEKAEQHGNQIVLSRVLFGGRGFFSEVAHKVTALYEQKKGDSNLWEVRNLDYLGEVVQVFVREKKQDFNFYLAAPSGKEYRGFAIHSFTFIENPGNEPQLRGITLSPSGYSFKPFNISYSERLKLTFMDGSDRISIEQQGVDTFTLVATRRTRATA